VAVSDGDEALLHRELELVREASHAGEIVAVSPEDPSLAYEVARAVLRLTLFGLLLFAVVVAVTLFFSHS
jgi:hypothetical protein